MTRNIRKKTGQLLVIPYLRQGAQGWELDTAVNGWLTNYTGKLEIVVIGDETPITRALKDEGKIEFIGMPRPDGMEPALDAARKLDAVMRLFHDCRTGFIYSYDDIYPVNPFGLQSVRQLKWIGSELTGNADSHNRFQRAMRRTREALLAEGKPVNNYSTHCPRWFDMDKLGEVMQRFNCMETPLLIESLYYNWWNPADALKADVSKPGNKYKVGIYRANYDLSTLPADLKRGVYWVNNSNVGYSRELIDIIRDWNTRKQ